MVAIKKLSLNALQYKVAASPYAALCDANLLAAIHSLHTTLRPAPNAIAVALSGGVDSACLALHLAVWAHAFKVPLFSFHVHHGLQKSADAWLAHVEALASLLGITALHEQVQVNLGLGTGMESAARDARYYAFDKMAERSGVQHVYLAHHQDDQAETVLMRLLRGAGPEGLGAMRAHSSRNGVQYLRPWLKLPRTRILKVGAALHAHTGWQAVQDYTNHSDDYTRGAVRERLTPHLNARWQGWQKVLARHAELSQQSANILQEVAAEDLQSLQCTASPYSFDLHQWRQLSPERQALVLRYWLKQAGLKMPTEARLADLMRQMRQLHALGFDRQMRVKHGDVWIVCKQGRVILQQRSEKNATAVPCGSQKSLE